MTTPPAPYIEALERALGRVIADAQRQVELQAARGDVAIARLEARNAELEAKLGGIERAVADSVASGIADGLRAINEQVASAIEEMRPDDTQVRALAERLDATEAGIAERLAAVETRTPEVTKEDVEDVAIRLAALYDATDGHVEAIRSDIAELRERPAPEIPPDRSSDIDDMLARLALVEERKPETPDLSGFATREDLQEVRSAIPIFPEERDWTPEIEAVRAAIPMLPEAPDLSGFATREDLEEVMASIPVIPEARDWAPEIAAVRDAIPVMPEAPDLSGFATREELEEVRASIPALPEERDWTAEIAEVRSAIPTLPEAPDLSGFATREELEEVRSAIPPVREERDWSPEIEAVRSAIPTIPAAPDLSGFATRDDVEQVRSEIPTISDARDWTPEIEAAAERSLAAASQAQAEAARVLEETRARLERHPGKFPLCRNWTETVHYAGDIVRHLGSTWQATRDTGRAPPHEDWICLAVAGRDGRTPEFRGLFAEGEDYRALDVVMLDGNSFVAVRDAPGACPGDGWKLLAMRGKPGRKSEIKGDKGDKGPAGKPVVGLELTEDARFILTNGDGSTVEADFYPVLEKIRK